METPPEPKHGRKLGIITVALTQAKIGIHPGQIRREIFPAANDARDRLEQLVIEDKFCEGAPFSWVGISIRQGLKNDLQPVFQGISKKHGDLALAIEIDTHDLIDASKDEVQLVLERAIFRSLVWAGRRYGRPMAMIEKIYAELEN